jgi:hypothetical protein
VSEAVRAWRVEELHTEEGRLDDVFRSITMPDTPASLKPDTSSSARISL